MTNLYQKNMNIKEYFNQHQNTYISDTQKLDVYQLFLDKKIKAQFSKRRSLLHVKSFVYSLVWVFFLFSLYGTYFFTDRYTANDNVLIWWNNAVQADYIANIVEFDGSFYIEHNGEQVQTSNIKDGDIVTLQEDSQLVFHINEATKTKLIWPAKFSIETIQAWENPQYKLNILQGDFVEVLSLEDKPKQTVQVNIWDIIVQEANGKALDYKLVKSEKWHVLTNNWWSLLVTTVNQNNEEQQTNVSKKQILAVQENDITLYDDIEKFAIAIKSKNISQTFTIDAIQEEIMTEPKIETESWVIQEDPITTWIEELTLDAILLTEDVEVSEDISNKLGSMFWDTESIVTPEQNDAMRSSLNKDFLLWDFKQLYIAIQQWDDKSINIAYNSLEKRVSRLYWVFDIEYTSQKAGTIQSKLVWLQNTVISFNKLVSSEYSMPPKYVGSLTTLGTRLGKLASENLWSDTEKAVQNWEALINSLPSNLRLY